MKRILSSLATIALWFLLPLMASAAEWSADQYDLYPGDFNGDGKTDILYVAKEPGGNPSGIVISTAGGAPTQLFQSWPSTYLGIPWSGRTYTAVIADFNGDGKDDIFLQRNSPGDHYLLLTNSDGRITGISQTLSNGEFGSTLQLSSDQHKIVAGDFTGGGKADLFLQSVSRAGTSAVIASNNSTGLLDVGVLQTLGNTALQFKLSAADVNLFVGDFNGDGRADLLAQPKPVIIPIDVDDISLVVPVFPPGTGGFAISQGGSTPFTMMGSSPLDRMAGAADWSPLRSTVVVGDFNGDGIDDVLLQPRRDGTAGYILAGLSNGSGFGSPTALGSGVTWASDTYRLIAGNFDGSGGAGVFFQALTSGGTDYYANSVTGGTVTATVHHPEVATTPALPSVVGHTVGSFDVSDAGAATYSIPIAVPPGVAGIQPQLSINYQSGGGNGPLGIGWQLGGFSSIGRCPKTIAQDGVVGAVQLTSDDGYCLDGARLRLVSGTYGTDGSVYQTELETFTRVTAHGSAGGNGPAYFTATGKNGMLYEYGNTGDSRIESIASGKETTVRQWALNRIGDRVGNYMTVQYQEDGNQTETPANGGSKGDYRPLSLTYTANAAASLSASYRVDLTWELRDSADDLIGYVGGGAVRDRYRLNRVETKYNDGTWRLVRKYQLGYRTASTTLRTKLSWIQECDGNSNCMPATTIGWQEGTFGWAGSDIPAGNIAYNASLFIDLNGDGRTDFVFKDSSNTWKVALGSSNFTFQSAITLGTGNASAEGFPIDLDGDGLRDFVFRNASGAWSYVRFVAAPGGGSFTTAAALPNSSWANSGPLGNLVGMLPLDFNGDGFEDVVLAYGFGLQVALNTSSGTALSFASPVSVFTPSADLELVPQTFGDPNNNFVARFQSGDFDGDGRGDLLYQGRRDLCSGEVGCGAGYRYEWHIARSTGSSFVEAGTVYSQPGTATSGRGPMPLLGDINGDGLTDIIYSQAVNPNLDVNNRHWRYALGSGNSSMIGGGGDTGVRQDSASAAIVDCDGDGFNDLLGYVYSGSTPLPTAQCLKSTGAALSGVLMDTGSTLTTTVADVNGDGLSDIVSVNLGTSDVSVRPHAGLVPDMVSNIVDGFGNTISVTYAPLTDSSVYTRTYDGVAPNFDTQGPMYVVKSFSASDGIGGTYSLSEKYTGLKVNCGGRGVLGFETREETDNRTNIRTKTTYWQDFPYTGMPSTVEVFQPGSSVLIAKTVNTRDSKVLDTSLTTARQLPYIQTSVQTSYEVNTLPSNGQGIAQVTTVTTLDNYGNLTNVTKTTVDLTVSSSPPTYVSSTSTTYDTPDVTNWCVGFALNQQATNTVPGLPAQTRTVQYVKDSSNVAACRVHQEIVEPNDVAVKVTTEIGYDVFGHPNSQTVSAANITSRTTTTSYGAKGVFPESVTNAEGENPPSKEYDLALGVPVKVWNEDGLRTDYAYDGFGRVSQEARPDGTKTAWTYRACTAGNAFCGDPRLRYQVEKQELDTSGSLIWSSKQSLDSLGRAVIEQSQSLSGAPAIITKQFDSQGRVLNRSQPYFLGMPAFYTSLTYDLISRVSKEERYVDDHTAMLQSITYQYNRLEQSITDARGHTTTRTSNVIGQVERMTDAAGGITKYEFDQFGNLTKTIDPLLNEIRNTFNIRGFKTSTRDPDTGTWNYVYYPTGEVWTQTDAKSQTATFTYDKVARVKTTAESEGTTTLTYGNSTTNRNVGKLTDIASPGGYSEHYDFDTLGRMENVRTTADSTAFDISNSYNASSGLLETTTYPTSTAAVTGSRFKVKYEYDSGLLKRVRDFNTPATVYWEQVSENAAGQPIDEQFGNGLHTLSTFDSVTGLLSDRLTGATAQVQYLKYQWDRNGNLTQRKDQNLTLTEDFEYDGLDRLNSAKLNGGANQAPTYDAIGNIQSKPGMGSYTYSASGTNSVRPHAATVAGTKNYGYDANGNMNTRDGNAIAWYSYNLPNRIDKGSNYSQFFYGARRDRYKQVAVTAAGGSLPAGTETTIYVGGGLFEKVTKPSGVVEYRHTIVSSAGPVAIRTLRSNGSGDTRYLHTDHSGSVDVISDETGTVVQRLSYDAFGKRRDASTWSGSPSAADWSNIAAITHRGFTFHEGLDNVDLVHMNGRVYDPELGRFLSADPYLQAPLLSQSFNRYSYVMNNPLSMTDPSGYSWLSKALRHIGAITRFNLVPTPKNFFEAIKAGPNQGKIDRYVLSHDWAYRVGYAAVVVSTVYIGGYGGAIYQSYYTYVATGSTTQALEVGAAAVATTYFMNSTLSGLGGAAAPAGSSAAGSSAGAVAGPNGGGLIGIGDVALRFGGAYAGAHRPGMSEADVFVEPAAIKAYPIANPMWAQTAPWIHLIESSDAAFAHIRQRHASDAKYQPTRPNGRFSREILSMSTTKDQFEAKLFGFFNAFTPVYAGPQAGGRYALEFELGAPIGRDFEGIPTGSLTVVVQSLGGRGLFTIITAYPGLPSGVVD